MLKNNLLIKGALFSVFSFFNQGVSFVLLIVLAKYILPDDYGHLSLFNTVVTFLSFVISLSTSGYISVAYFKKSLNEFTKDFSVVLFITFSVTTFLFVLLLLWGEFISAILQVPLNLLYYAVLISISNCFYQILLDVYRIKEDLRKYGIFSCSFALINFILALFFVVSLKLGWEGRVYSQLLTCLLYGIVSIYVWKRFNFFNFRKIDKKSFKTIICWGVPLIPHLASAWIRQGGDRYIINSYFSIEEVGIFSFALNLSNIIFILGSAFNQTNSVYIYKILSSESKEKRDSLNKQTKQILGVYVAGTILITVACVLLVPLILPNYSPSLPYFLILSLSGFLQCIYFLYTNYLFYYDKTNNLMYITFGCSVLHLILSLLLTKYSLYFTCFLYVVLKLAMAVLVIIQAKKLLKEHL